MTVMESSVGPADQLARLTFLRTVDRTLVHRRALSEVFLTDSIGVDDAAYVAGAQLPASHAYYGDHIGHRAVDAVLLLECARQAETLGGHVHLGVGPGTKFILRSWSMRLPGLFDALPDGRAAELSMSVVTNRPPGLARLRSLTYDISLSTAHGHVGDIRMDVGYLSDDAYSFVRGQRRGTPPPSSEDWPTAPTTVDPRLVGRSDPANVVITDAVVTGGFATASVRPVFTNRSLFDHAQDHVPGMVLTEAARQLALLVGQAAPRTAMVGFDLAFDKYAELDAAVTVTVNQRDGGFQVAFHQDGETIAAGELSTAEVPATEGARS